MNDELLAEALWFYADHLRDIARETRKGERKPLRCGNRRLAVGCDQNADECENLATQIEQANAQRHGSTQIGMGTTPPLRKIVATTYDEYGLDCDVLECGHTVRSPVDRNGAATSATRRRCKFCVGGDQ